MTPAKRKWLIFGGLIALGLLIFALVPKDVIYPDGQATNTTSPQVSVIRVSAYLNDAPEPFLVKVTSNADEATFQAAAKSEESVNLQLDCTTAQTQVYVELSDPDGRFRRGEWFPAKCGASWGYFVSISENDAGIINLNFLQDPGH